MATSSPTGQKRCRVTWEKDEERKLIELWAEILQKTDGKMITRKKKEAIVTVRLNEYVTKALGKHNCEFTEKEVRNKIDSMLKKGKQLYCTFRRTGEEVDGEAEIKLDMDAAERAWPNFKTFLENFKDHPSLGPGSVEDSATTPDTKIVTTRDPQGELVLHISDSSDCESEVEATHGKENEQQPPKKLKPSTEVTTRVRPKKDKPSAKLLSHFAQIQQTMQKAMIEHESRMHTESLSFQAKMEQERLTFEVKLNQQMQQQSQQFQLALAQQNQLFQAELFKKLFDKQ